MEGLFFRGSVLGDLIGVSVQACVDWARGGVSVVVINIRQVGSAHRSRHMNKVSSGSCVCTTTCVCAGQSFCFPFQQLLARAVFSSEIFV